MGERITIPTIFPTFDFPTIPFSGLILWWNGGGSLSYYLRTPDFSYLCTRRVLYYSWRSKPDPHSATYRCHVLWERLQSMRKERKKERRRVVKAAECSNANSTWGWGGADATSTSFPVPVVASAIQKLVFSSAMKFLGAIRFSISGMKRMEEVGSGAHHHLRQNHQCKSPSQHPWKASTRGRNDLKQRSSKTCLWQRHPPTTKSPKRAGLRLGVRVRVRVNRNL